jgi:HAMP domain-containing protein
MIRARWLTLIGLLAAFGPPALAQRLYWREPQAVLGPGTRFPSVVARGGLVAAVWQEMTPPRLLGGGGEIRLSVATTRDLQQWNTTLRFAGPYEYQREEVAIYSLAVDRDGTVFVAILSGQSEVTLLRSRDAGRSFETLARLDAGATILTPTVSVTDSGRLLLFVIREREDFLEIYYTVSSDGVRWESFRPLVGERGQGAAGLRSTYLPYHVSWNGREYVAYQGLPAKGGTYQLYLTQSADGGSTWDAGREMSFGETLDGQEWDKDTFNNQRPFLYPLGDRLALAWERQFRSNPSQVYYAEVDGQGAFLRPPESVTEGGAAALAPRLVQYKDGIRLFWFDKSQGENEVFLGERTAARWERTQLSVLEGGSLPGGSYFPQPIEQGGQLYVFWENRVGQTSRLYLLEPDQTVAAPALQAASYRVGQPSQESAVRYTWRYPSDSSGIAGASYVWSKNPSAAVPKEFPIVLPPANSVSVKADSDGTWYFRLAVQDYAGNWSQTVSLSYQRDTTPPAPPQLELPPADENGFLASNTFSVRWLPDPAETPVGYSYALEYLGAEAPPAELKPAVVSPRVMTAETEASYRNRDDGYWRFAVSAIDAAGNVGVPATALLRLNKYMPETYITYVNTVRDPLGETRLTIGGRGFAVGGKVTEVLLDRDGRAPYDYTLLGSEGRFRVVDDRLIRDVVPGDVEEGLYRVGVVHPLRGVYFTGPQLNVESSGTVKIGDFSYRYVRPWQSVRRPAYLLSMNALVIWLVVAFLAVSFALSLRRLATVVQEGRVLRREVLAVLRGERPLALPGRAKVEELRKKGMGLRLKFTILIMILVLITVLMVSVPLGYYMVRTQRATLTDGLLVRAEVLLDSIASNAGSALQRNADYELLDLPDAQVKSMEEARFITVTGRGATDRGKFDYIWGSNDPDINRKTRAGRFDRGSPGTVRLEDGLTQAIADLEVQINTRAREQLTTLVSERQRVLTEAAEVGRREGIESPRFAELQRELNALDGRISAQLRGIGSVTGRYPEFNPEKLEPAYTFYRPIVYRQEGEDIYFRGAVRMGISTEKIRAELTNATRTLLIQSGIIALIAAGLGLLGALLMASLTVRPIIQLTREVRKISATEDKEQLKDEPPIEVKTKDEIGQMSTEITRMRDGLIKAAIASKDLTVGKEVQKMFIPLEADASGRKGSSGGEQDANIEIFGFYEGAKGVSGDYFDYKKLTDKYYAFIKCDVAGKGVPAALIMVEVATIFSTYFRDWTPQAPGLKIDRLASLINDMLEERGFKGRFAALTLAIINEESGRSHFCNAGDVKLHLFRARSRHMEQQMLPDAPAAGVFPSDLVEMKGGFKTVALDLSPGDTVFLFTDGIEEAKRLLRDNQFRPTSVEGVDSEEMGLERIDAILNAVLNRGIFRLTKSHNPLGDEALEFDFSGGTASVEEAVLALVGVEKVFRLVPDPAAGGDDRVLVDVRVGEFLKKYFRQFDRYFGHPVAGEGRPGDPLVFSHLREDDQYDDLTILAVRKK